ncbi:hypothetical protein [Frateuria defendens]|uniref:hypothetical protein n=1 Tax=Frateuria defendens TaxID=2219559 RepID=UPI00066FC386|nr:hypothetical protein [Frateuria defendens]
MKRSWLRLSLPWLALLLVALGAVALRYVFIEPSGMEQRCGVARPPLWCAPRQWLVLGFLSYGYGIAALAATALALLHRRVATFWLAAALGAFALAMYCENGGAFALLLGSLGLLRQQAGGAAPGGQHRHGEQQVEAQP